MDGKDEHFIRVTPHYELLCSFTVREIVHGGFSSRCINATVLTGSICPDADGIQLSA